MLITGIARLRLTDVIVAVGVGVNWDFGLVEHLALQQVRPGAATEALAPVQIKLFQLCPQFFLLSPVLMLQFNNTFF
ncbi:hypothetical protein [Edwardsiella tarda]